jgi:hypothetical protein
MLYADDLPIRVCTHKSGSVFDVRFSPDATKLLHSSEMTQCAKTGQGLFLVSEEGRGP